jgi:hypothetical protein
MYEVKGMQFIYGKKGILKGQRVRKKKYRYSTFKNEHLNRLILYQSSSPSHTTQLIRKIA